MVRCISCQERAVISGYCKSHFSYYFEKKAVDTIKKHRLIKKTDKVAVAVSGGKDSLTILHILHKNKYDVTAIAIDEGIEGYRDRTLKDMVVFCKKNGIRYKIYSFEKEFGKTLDKILGNDKLRPCTVCGVFRRYLLNKYSKEYDVIATGHNMDDESQAVIMNVLKNNLKALYMAGPSTGYGRTKGMAQRVKPLFFCLEKEVMAYSFLNNITTNFNECPHVYLSFRMRIRDNLNSLENKQPGTKKNILEWAGKFKKTHDKEKYSICCLCKEASSGEICNACEMVKKICS